MGFLLLLRFILRASVEGRTIITTAGCLFSA
jgi:hypothetical protein